MQQFLDYLGSFRGGRRFVSLEEERALLQAATARFGMALDDARSALLVGARQSDMVLESEVADEVAGFLSGRLRQGERIARADFRDATDFFTARARNSVSIEEARQRVRQLVTRAGWSPKPAGWLWGSTGWFDRIPEPPSAASTRMPATPDLSAGGAFAAPAGGAMGGPDGGTGDVLQAWGEALRSRNVDRIIALYAPDALLLATAEDQPLIGPARIRTYFNRLASYQGLSVSFQDELQRLRSDRATLVSGLYVFSWQDPQTGAAVVTPARYSFAVRDNSGSVQGRIAMQHSSRVPGNYPGADAI